MAVSPRRSSRSSARPTTDLMRYSTTRLVRSSLSGVPLDGLYLPAGAWFAGGARRLVKGYSGAALTLRRESDNVTAPFGFGWASDYLDAQAIREWAGVSRVFVDEVWDQAGSARRLPVTAGRPPLLNITQPRPTICHSIDLISQTNQRGYDLTGISLERTALSIFLQLRPYYQVNTAHFELHTGTTRDLGLIGSSTGVLSASPSASLPADVYIPCQPSVVSMVSTPTEVTTRVRGTDYVTAAVAAKAATGLRFQIGISDNTKYMACDYGAYVVYDTARSDRVAIHQALEAMFETHTNTGNRRVVIDGDSIPGGTGSDYGMSPAYWAEKLLDPHYDLCVRSGFGLRYITSLEPNVQTRVCNIMRPGDVLHVVAGGNDIQNGATPEATWTAIQSYVSKVRATVLGPVRVSIGTVIPRNSGTPENGSPGVGALNTLIRNGWLSTLGCDSMVDYAADPVLISHLGDPDWAPDNTHWRAPGSKRIGELMALGITAAGGY